LLAFNHTPQDYLGAEQLRQLQQTLDSDPQLMRCSAFFTRDCPANRIDAQKVLACAPVAAGAAVVVCGPAGFLEASR
jgi:ferredoxin-NADP reductase